MGKVQTQLLVDLPIRQRADALGLVLVTSRADVLRKALEGGGLKELEATYRDELEQLDPIARRCGMTRLELADYAAQEDISLATLKAGIESIGT